MFKTIETPDYKSLLSECFSMDKDLIMKWHIHSGKTLDECVEKTFHDMQELKIVIYKFVHDSQLVGYFGKEICPSGQWLTGFFIVPEFRTDEGRKAFWQAVESEFDSAPYYCGLYTKNEPAIKFIEKRGGELVKSMDYPDGPVVIYRIGA